MGEPLRVNSGQRWENTGSCTVQGQRGNRVRATFLAFEAPYFSWPGETAQSLLKLERGCSCKTGVFRGSAPCRRAVRGWLFENPRKPGRSLQECPRKPASPGCHGRFRWPQAEPGVCCFLNEGFAVSSALLIHLKYNKEAFRTFWKRLQKMSQKQNSVTAWWAEGNEPADFTVRECG